MFLDIYEKADPDCNSQLLNLKRIGLGATIRRSSTSVVQPIAIVSCTDADQSGALHCASVRSRYGVRFIAHPYVHTTASSREHRWAASVKSHDAVRVDDVDVDDDVGQ